MTDEYEPRRLFEAHEAPADLRRLLARAHDDVSSQAMREQLVRAATGRAMGAGPGVHGRAAATRWATRIAQHPITFLTAAAALGVGAGALYISGAAGTHTARAPRPTSAEVRPARVASVEPERALVPLPAAPSIGALGEAQANINPADAPRVARATGMPAHAHAHRVTSSPSESGKAAGRLGGHIAAGSSSRRVAEASTSEAPPAVQVTGPTVEARSTEPNAADPKPAGPKGVEARALEAKAAEAKPAQTGAEVHPDRPAAEQPRVEMLGTEEAQLLRSARRALATSPQRTLSLTDEHLRRYPRGILDQEREALAIEALMKLGRADDARARARAFELAYPDSPHRARIERAITRVPGAINGP